MDEFLGVVKIFGGNYTPLNWLPCDGRALAINTYETLYALIGTTYGGDGVTTFKLPDLRGVVAVGAGTSAAGSSFPVNGNGGSETFTMTQATMPAHLHALTLNQGSTLSEKACGTGSSTTDPQNAIPGTSVTPTYAASGSTPMLPMVSTLAMQSAGTPAPAALDNRSPFMAMNYIICVNGLWPSPN